jgi:hypothetical protein
MLTSIIRLILLKNERTTTTMAKVVASLPILAKRVADIYNNK